MRVEVTRWSRLEEKEGRVSFRAVTTQTYLTGEEVAQCNLDKYTEANGPDNFRLLLDVRHLRQGIVPAVQALANRIEAEVRHQEEAKTQNEGSEPAPPSEPQQP